MSSANEHFVRSRRETLRYHELFYARTPLGAPGTWLARPHRLVLDALGRVDQTVHAYDLGAGVGRHTLPMAKRLPIGSRVTAVDLLPSALHRLAENARDAALADRIECVVADLNAFEFSAADAGLVVCFSALEHLPSTVSLRALLARCRDATVPGGFNVFGVFADRVERAATGERPAVVELALTSTQTFEAFDSIYREWNVLKRVIAPVTSTEDRDGKQFELTANLVSFVAQRPPARPRLIDTVSATGCGRPGRVDQEGAPVGPRHRALPRKPTFRGGDYVCPRGKAVAGGSGLRGEAAPPGASKSAVSTAGGTCPGARRAPRKSVSSRPARSSVRARRRTRRSGTTRSTDRAWCATSARRTRTSPRGTGARR